MSTGDEPGHLVLRHEKKNKEGEMQVDKQNCGREELENVKTKLKQLVLLSQ